MTENKKELTARVESLFQESIKTMQQILQGKQIDVLIRMAEIIRASIAQGGKLMLCGNGGSAADAQHLAAELLVRLRPHVNRDGIPAISLATDSSSLTACANDYSFEVFYERMLLTLGRPGDVLLGISTSGKSPNIVRALHAARKRGITALGFLGGNGGTALPECDLAFVVPSSETGRIQESHITAGRALMELVEDQLLADGDARSYEP